MAATDRTYRSQHGLDVVFGVTCLLMLALVPDDEKQKHLEEAEQELAEARRERDQVRDAQQAQLKKDLVAKAKKEARAQSLKADYDSLVSIYNIAVEERDEASEGS